MSEIIYVVEEAPEGGYTARALGESIVTQAGSAADLHARVRDAENVREQEALGVLGVNLTYGAFYHRDDPTALIRSLMDDLSRDRIEIDMLKMTGPAFGRVDNRLVSLQLVEQGFTDAAMFTADGEVVQPGELLH